MRAAGFNTGALPDSADELMTQLIACGCYDDKHPLDSRLRGACRARAMCNGSRAVHGIPVLAPRHVGRARDQRRNDPPPFWRDNRQSARGSPCSRSTSLTPMTAITCSQDSIRPCFVAIQPPRGFGVDPEAVYHAPDLPPCHHYAAFYRWLAQEWQADALIHFGTHGTLEWLPGKSVAMSADCAPDALLADLRSFIHSS